MAHRNLPPPSPRVRGADARPIQLEHRGQRPGAAGAVPPAWLWLLFHGHIGVCRTLLSGPALPCPQAPLLLRPGSCGQARLWLGRDSDSIICFPRPYLALPAILISVPRSFALAHSIE